MRKIIFLFILISSLSCKKVWFDYTNKYTGNFEFTVYQMYFDASTGVRNDTTYVYNGIIKRIKRGQIRIKYGSRANEYYNVDIDKDGEFSQGYLGGKFSDNDHVTISNSSGGNGGGTRTHIIGIRR